MWKIELVGNLFNREASEIVHEWNGHTQIFSCPQVRENSIYFSEKIFYRKQSSGASEVSLSSLCRAWNEYRHQMSNRLLVVDPSVICGGNSSFGLFASALSLTDLPKWKPEWLMSDCLKPNHGFIFVVLQSTLSEMDSFWTLCPS